MFSVLEGLQRAWGGSLLPSHPIFTPPWALLSAGFPQPGCPFLQDKPIHPSELRSISTSSRKLSLNSSMDNNVWIQLLVYDNNSFIELLRNICTFCLVGLIMCFVYFLFLLKRITCSSLEKHYSLHHLFIFLTYYRFWVMWNSRESYRSFTKDWSKRANCSQ